MLSDWVMANVVEYRNTYFDMGLYYKYMWYTHWFPVYIFRLTIFGANFYFLPSTKLESEHCLYVQFGQETDEMMGYSASDQTPNFLILLHVANL